MQNLVIDFDEPREKQNYLATVREYRGKKRITVKQFRPKRSTKQNDTYFGMVVEPFADWLMVQAGEKLPDIEKAHAVLTDTYLRVPEVDANGEIMLNLKGEPLMRTMSTTELDTEGFSAFFEDCRNLLAQMCDIIVPDPDPNYARR